MPDTTRIREQNDDFRKGLGGGQIVVTQGIAARNDVWEIVQQVRKYNSFDSRDDSYGERDFGTIRVDAQRIFWKIDYYGKDMESGSPDPADPSATIRTMTIMLAEEY